MQTCILDRIILLRHRGQSHTRSALNWLLMYLPSRFASRPEAQQVLRRFCGICGQWLACIRSAKLHYRSVHPTIYETFNMVAAADCKRVGHLVSPCSFCGGVVARTDQHSATCPVLWQARVCCLVNASASDSSCLATRHGGHHSSDGVGRRIRGYSGIF